MTTYLPASKQFDTSKSDIIISDGSYMKYGHTMRNDENIINIYENINIKDEKYQQYLSMQYNQDDEYVANLSNLKFKLPINNNVLYILQDTPKMRSILIEDDFYIQLQDLRRKDCAIPQFLNEEYLRQRSIRMEDNTYFNLQFMFPYVTYFICLYENNFDFRIAYNKEEITTLDSNIYLANLYNCYSTFDVCMGTSIHSYIKQSFSLYLKSKNIIEKNINGNNLVKNIISYFWNSKFNLDITENVRDYISINSQIGGFLKWHINSLTDPLFIFNKNLILYQNSEYPTINSLIKCKHGYQNNKKNDIYSEFKKICYFINNYNTGDNKIFSSDDDYAYNIKKIYSQYTECNGYTLMVGDKLYGGENVFQIEGFYLNDGIKYIQVCKLDEIVPEQLKDNYFTIIDSSHEYVTALKLDNSYLIIANNYFSQSYMKQLKFENENKFITYNDITIKIKDIFLMNDISYGNSYFIVSDIKYDESLNKYIIITTNNLLLVLDSYFLSKFHKFDKFQTIKLKNNITLIPNEYYLLNHSRTLPLLQTMYKYKSCNITKYGIEYIFENTESGEINNFTINELENYVYSCPPEIDNMNRHNVLLINNHIIYIPDKGALILDDPPTMINTKYYILNNREFDITNNDCSFEERVNIVNEFYNHIFDGNSIFIKSVLGPDIQFKINDIVVIPDNDRTKFHPKVITNISLENNEIFITYFNIITSETVKYTLIPYTFNFINLFMIRKITLDYNNIHSGQIYKIINKEYKFKKSGRYKIAFIIPDFYDKPLIIFEGGLSVWYETLCNNFTLINNSTYITVDNPALQKLDIIYLSNGRIGLYINQMRDYNRIVILNNNIFGAYTSNSHAEIIYTSYLPPRNKINFNLTDTLFDIYGNLYKRKSNEDKYSKVILTEFLSDEEDGE